MSSQEAAAQRILAEARRVCEEHGEGVTITLIGTIGEQFVIIFNVASLHDKEASVRDAAVNEIASRLQALNDVARVCYEVLPDRKRSN